MADAFFQALYCRPPRVFGRALRPFSLSHSFLLSKLKNTWLREASGSRSDLLHAVWVCSHSHEVNADQLQRPPIARMMWFALWSRGYDYAVERQAFLTYLSDYLEIPEHWEGEKSGRPFRAPWQYHFALILAQECGLSVTKAWDMPVSLARCYYDVLAEQKGDDSLVAVHEYELAEAEGVEL